MRSKLRIVFLLMLMYTTQVAYADFLNMGGAEMVVIVIVCLFVMAFLIGIIFLIYFLTKRLITKHPKRTTTVDFHVGSNASRAKLEEEQPLPIKGNPVLSQKIALPQQYETRYVHVNEILRCEADNNYTDFCFVDGEKLLISKSLKEYVRLLQPYGFIRTHQSHLVNPTYVKSWLKEDGGTLLMTNGDKIPVSKPNRELVRDLLSGSFEKSKDQSASALHNH